MSRITEEDREQLRKDAWARYQAGEYRRFEEFMGEQEEDTAACQHDWSHDGHTGYYCRRCQLRHKAYGEHVRYLRDRLAVAERERDSLMSTKLALETRIVTDEERHRRAAHSAKLALEAAEAKLAVADEALTAYAQWNESGKLAREALARMRGEKKEA